MAVQRLPGDTQFFAEVAHFGFPLSHRGHGQANLRRRHFEGASAGPSPCAGRSEPGDGSLGDECSLKLG